MKTIKVSQNTSGSGQMMSKFRSGVQRVNYSRLFYRKPCWLSSTKRERPPLHSSES